MDLTNFINSEYYIGKKLEIARSIARMNGREIKVHDSSGWLLDFNWLTSGWDRKNLIYVTVKDGIIMSIVRET
jgi:hypothetical protein